MFDVGDRFSWNEGEVWEIIAVPPKGGEIYSAKLIQTNGTSGVATGFITGILEMDLIGANISYAKGWALVPKLQCECGNKNNPVGQGHSGWCKMFKQEF